MADHTITVYKTRALLLKDVKEDQFQLKVHLCRKKKKGRNPSVKYTTSDIKQFLY
jgi:hypothetical protein